jgi:hypothetical protein
LNFNFLCPVEYNDTTLFTDSCIIPKSKTDTEHVHALRSSTVLDLNTLAESMITLRELKDESPSASEEMDVVNNINSDDGQKRCRSDSNTSLTPGSGNKILVSFNCHNDTQLRAWLDSGSTVTLVAQKYIERMKLRTYTIKGAKRFQGVFR